MFERSKRTKAVEALRGGVANTIGFLENGAPHRVEALGHRLHDKAAAMHLMSPRRGIGTAIALGVVGLAVAAILAVNVGKLDLEGMIR